MADILKVIDIVKKLLTTPTHRFIVGEATSHTTKNATVIYDDKVGSPAENLTFPIPDDGTPPPQPKAVIKPDSLVAYPGQTTALDGSQSTGLVPLQYQWSKLSGDFDILNPTASVTSIKVSDTAQPGASFGVSLQVTDANGTSDSTQKSISIIGPPPPPSQIKTKVVAVNASKQDSGKEASKVLDGDFETRWSADGIGEWIEFTFDQHYKIKTVKLTGYHYDKSYDFEINGKSFTCPANRTPNTLIDFDLSSLNIDSDKIRLIGKGNNSTDYNSYREIEFWGEPGSPPPTVAVIKPDNPSGQPGTIIALDGSQSTGKQPLKYFWTADINTTAIKVLNPESVSTNVQISSTATPGTSAKINLSVTDADGMPAATSKQVSIVGDIPPPPPPPPPTGLTRLLAFADNDTTNDAEDVLSAMMKVSNVAEYEFVGDGPYSKSGTKWVSMMKKYFDSEKVKKLRISQGNHEHKESESQQTEDDIEDWIPSLNKSPEALDWTSSGQVGNVYVISGNTQDMDVEFKREQFNWLKSELEKAKSLRASGAIDWIVYMCHKPFFTLKSSHSPYTAVRFNYKDIFRDAQVDFVLHGHNHNTQLWLPMVPNDSDANGEGSQLFTRLPDGTFDFTKDHGAAYIVTGHAGHEWNSINDSGSGVQNVQHYRDSGKFGFTQLDFEGKKATVKSIDSDGRVHFEYKVSREGGSPPPPPPPPPGCPTGQCIDPITRQCRLPNSNETIDQTTGECKIVTIPPPPPGNFPVNVNWYYSSDQVLSQNSNLTSSKYISNESPNQILLPSGASGAKNHKISDGWLEIDSGGGNGRVYWDYVKHPTMKADPKYGKSIAMTGTFKLQSADNLSIKDGNHGTDGSIIEDMDLVFGGFGLSFHETEVQSKVEYNHDVSQGNEESQKYPNNEKISRTGTTKYFITIVANDSENSVKLNAWLDFGQGWELVMKDRTWKQGDNSWKPPNGIPSGKDKAQIEAGPAHIVRNHIWTRANDKNLQIQKVQIGIPI